MALSGKVTTEGEGKVFTAKFTNGTVQQLEELAEFLENQEVDISTDPEKRLRDVIETSIGFLERVKNDNQRNLKSADWSMAKGDERIREVSKPIAEKIVGKHLSDIKKEIDKCYSPVR